MIKDFNRDEKIALIAVAKFIANQDGRLEKGELEQFNQISIQEGFEDFHELFAEVDKEVKSLSELSHAIGQVVNPQIRDEIVAYALTMSRADGFTSTQENETIQYLCRIWNIDLVNVKS